MDVDIGLVYSGERAWLSELLPNLARSADGLTQRVILIDNASRDGTDGFVNLFPRILLLRNNRPRSYAENMNRVIENSDARYVLALNTDMRFDPAEQCVGKTVRFLDERPLCGLAGCRVYSASGEYAHSARRFPSPGMIFARRLPGPWFSRSLARYLYADRDPRESFECDWVSGCFMMLRRAACRDVGWFDRNFGKYFEDVDYCWRMAQHGWSVMHCGDASCVHFEQRGSRIWFSRDAAMHLRAYLLWLWKRSVCSAKGLPGANARHTPRAA